MFVLAAVVTVAGLGAFLVLPRRKSPAAQFVGLDNNRE